MNDSSITVYSPGTPRGAITDPYSAATGYLAGGHRQYSCLATANIELPMDWARQGTPVTLLATLAKKEKGNFDDWIISPG